MDVTRSNFAEVLDELQDVVKDSSFLAVDGEFTGLMAGSDVAAFDTPSEYYQKLKDGSMKFLFIQFGLCAFKFNATSKEWTHNAYNFYIFPKPFNRQAVDIRFLCQSSSIDFLTSNGFDFNKLFREGIPFLPLEEEQKQRTFMEEKHRKERAQSSTTPMKDSAASVPIPDDCSDLIEENCVLIEEFLKSTDDELKLKPSNAFVRKLMYQSVEERFSKLVKLDTKTAHGSRTLVVSRIGTEEERLERQLKAQTKELQDLEEAIGFTKVIKLLTGSGKMVVGHNMMLDMCHILNQFCTPLPEDYSEFKEMLHTSFPCLLDTKYMSGCPPISNFVKFNMLGDLYSRLKETPFSMPIVECDKEGCGYSTSAEKYHEAGYDAYITGMCLIAMANHLDAKCMHPDIATLPLLKPFLNRILLTRIQDFGYINLNGEDPVLPRNHVFHVTFPREWKQNDIVRLFTPICGIYVSWLNDTSAYASLYEREKAASVMKTLKRSSTYTVTPYNKHRATAAPSKVPSSPTTAQLKRRSLEKLADADRPAEQPNKRKRNSFTESKFSRRSIDTIFETEEDLNTSADNGTKVSAATKLQFEESDNWE